MSKFADSDYFPSDRSNRPHPEETSERRLLIVLLDLSHSMSQLTTQTSGSGVEYDSPIKALQSALRSFLIDEIGRDDLFTLNGELAIGGFWGDDQLEWLSLGAPARDGESASEIKVYWARGVRAFAQQNFARDEDLQLEADGATPLCNAMTGALDLIEQREREWAASNKTRQHRPVVVVLTDGAPTDMYEYDEDSRRFYFDQPTEQYSSLKQRAHTMEENKKLAFWIACLPGADLNMLLPLADKGNLIELGDHGIHSFISLLNASLKAVGNGSPAEVYARLSRMWAADE